MNSPLHQKIRVISAGHRIILLQRRTVPDRASADVFIYRRRPAPIRYVTTQEKILKNRPVPGRLSKSPVMCKSVKSYNVSFICDRSISSTNQMTLATCVCKYVFDYGVEWAFICTSILRHIISRVTQHTGYRPILLDAVDWSTCTLY